MPIKNIFKVLKADFKVGLIAILFVAVGYLFIKYQELINDTTKPCIEELQELRKEVLKIQNTRLEEGREMNRIVDSLKNRERARDKELDSLLYIIKSKTKKIK
jgi:hypothetical protein